VWFIQLDDLKGDQLSRLAPRILLDLETSPGNHQAWFALDGQHDKEFARRVRRGAGTDKRATGAVRVAGSLNFKEKYAPDFPRVRIIAAQPGRTVTPAELEQLGVVAAPQSFAPFIPALSSGRSGSWPSYKIALERSPPNSDGTGPDRSNADLRWSMTAISWGFGQEETAARLMDESSKARERGRPYADMIAETAARFVAERRPTSQRQRISGHERG
jgi:hypothetical protein